MPRIRVVVVDDHEVVRMGIVTHLRAEPDVSVVAEAASARQALDVVADKQPDVVVLDVRLPDGSGINVCKEICDEYPDIKVLIFTSFADPDALEASMAAGASGFLLKRVHLDSLSDAVRQVTAGEEVLDREAEEILQRRLSGGSADDPRLSQLTPQERRVLELIADGLTNRAIAEEMALAEKTVKNYVSNVLRKLGMRRRSEAAAFRASLG